MWTKEILHELVAERMREYRFIAVSNREPYIHARRDGRIQCMQPASGLATALDPIMRASGGVWVAHGSGDADRLAVDKHDHVLVPPSAPQYTLRRVWLPPKLEREYYYGLSNEGLWPLCHVVFQRPQFSRQNWESYRVANELFADAVLEEAGGKPAFVFIQDYHFGLLPRMLKRRNPHLIVAQFWHIPWPNRETFRAFPWKEELLDGMLGNDLLGFHLRYHCANFLETIDRNVEALVDTERGTVVRSGHSTSVRAFPISIDFEQQSSTAQSDDIQEDLDDWAALLGGRPEILGIGIDRVDYTKGIIERLQAVDALLERRRDCRGRLVFVQVGVPSRTAVGDYARLNDAVLQQVERVNQKWGRDGWKPIVLVHRHVDQRALIALHLMADFCVVSSLHDGMNLVAKEFAGSRYDEDGVLILSRFTGAARELTEALLVNPFAPDEIACAMEAAIDMSPAERRRRMRRMRKVVQTNNVYRWAGKIMQSLAGMVDGVADEEEERVESKAGAA